MPTPAAPWLASALAVGLSLYEWSCEGVGALVLAVLLVALRLDLEGASTLLSSFWVDLLGAPSAVGVLAVVPASIALSKRRSRKLQESWRVQEAT